MLTWARMRWGSVTKADDGSFLVREFGFEERRDFFVPDGERSLASVPIGEAADPFGDDDAVVGEAVGDGEGAAVGFDAVGFGEDAEAAGAGFFEGEQARRGRGDLRYLIYDFEGLGGCNAVGIIDAFPLTPALSLRERGSVVGRFRSFWSAVAIAVVWRWFGNANADVVERDLGGRRDFLPFAAAVEHFADVLADVAGAFGIGFQAAGDVGMFERFLDAEENGFGGEEAFLDADGFGERVAATLGGGVHEGEQGAPIHRAAAGEMAGAGVEEAEFVGGDEDEAGFVEAAAAGAAEHLEDFVGLERLFDVVAAIGSGGEGDAAQGKIDAGGEAHGGDDDAKLAGLGERFDDAGARAVAQAAVMIGDAALEQFGEMLADDEFLFVAELERIGRGQIAGEFGGHGFGGLAARREDENGAEVFGEAFGDEARPIALNLAGDVEIEIVGVEFLQRDGADVVADENGVAAKAVEPSDDGIGIGDAAAEEQKLGLGRREGEGEFVIQAAVGVADHLVFVHDEEGGAVALDEAVFLGFERGDEDGGVEIFGEVAGGDADIPAASAPFGEFVIGEGAGGDGVDGLAAIFAAVGPKLEDQGLARAGGGLDDDVLAGTQRGDGLLLPEVGNGDLIQGGEVGELSGERHGENIIENRGWENGICFCEAVSGQWSVVSCGGEEEEEGPRISQIARRGIRSFVREARQRIVR